MKTATKPQAKATEANGKPHKGNGKPSKPAKPAKPPKPAKASEPLATPPRTMTAKEAEIADICKELQERQRKRAMLMKSRIMIENRRQAEVASAMGYQADLDKKERKKLFKDAAETIEAVLKGEQTHDLQVIIAATQLSIDAYNKEQASLEKFMKAAVRKLSVIDWVEAPEQRGFSDLGLAIVIGECGDLSNYANPAKVWRRLGLAPWTYRGHTHMGATWKSGKGEGGSLPAPEWAEFKYSPRRRSVSWLIGEGLIKQNTVDGPYRKRWLAMKVRTYQLHPDWMVTDKDTKETKSAWSPCDKCKDYEAKDKPDCETCGGTGMRCKRANLRGMVVAVKLLLKNLWLEWHGHPPDLKLWQQHAK